MDISQIYLASPDWIKGMMVALPFITFYATARLFARRAEPSPEPRPMPVTTENLRPAAAKPVLEHDRDMQLLLASTEIIRDGT